MRRSTGAPNPDDVDLEGSHQDEAVRRPTTTSITRSFSNLDPVCFFISLAGLAALRTLLVQPLNVMLVQRRLCVQQQPSFMRSSSSTRLWRVGLPAFVLGGAFSEAASLFTVELLRDHNLVWGWRAAVVGGGDTEPQHLPPSGNTNVGDDGGGGPSALRDFTAGFVSDGVRQIILTPFSVVATRQVLWSSQSHTTLVGAWETVRVLWRERRLRAMYAGFGTSIAVGPLWTASWWVLYQQLKLRLYSTCDPFLIDDAAAGASEHGHGVVPSWWRCRGDNVLIDTTASVLASAICAAFFNPFLVVRARLMATRGATLRSVVGDLGREGMQRSAGRGGVWVARRLRPFFAGSFMTVAQNVVDGVGASLTYEHAKRWAER